MKGGSIKPEKIGNYFFIVIFSLLLFTSCTQQNINKENNSSTASAETQETAPQSETAGNDAAEDWSAGAEITRISLEGEMATIEGAGAVAEDGNVKITSAGAYALSGTLGDGQILIEADGVVRILLNGVTVSCSDNAPFYVIQAEKTILTLAENTENQFQDGDAYSLEDAESNEPNAAIFSKDDLEINGTGMLTVTANYNNGIQSKDNLEISGGHINVTAANHGIKGKDSITITGGTIQVAAGGDALQSDNETDAEKGYITIMGGVLDLTCGEDGIQAQTTLTIRDGDITITAGDGYTNAPAKEEENPWGFIDPQLEEQGTTTASETDETQEIQETLSQKGLKASVQIEISDGNFTLNTADDAVHSNKDVWITGGVFVVQTGDDAIHADQTVQIDAGELEITDCYEGIEGKDIVINAGDFSIRASDDAINAAGGDTQNQGFNGMQPGGGDYSITVNGGSLFLNADGDAIDSNGSLSVKEGEVIIWGATTGHGDGLLDFAGTCEVQGGEIIATGGNDMLQLPDESSTQNSVLLVFAQEQEAGTVTRIETESGEEVLTIAPDKEYQALLYSSEKLKTDETYLVYVGGAATGEVKNGVYTNATVADNNQVLSFTMSSVSVTAAEEGAVVASGAQPGMGGLNGDWPANGQMPNGDWPADGQMPNRDWPADGQMPNGNLPGNGDTV